MKLLLFPLLNNNFFFLQMTLTLAFTCDVTPGPLPKATVILEC